MPAAGRGPATAHPATVGNPTYVVIDLDFDTVGEAEKVLGFLEQNVWASSDNAPALTERPQTQILEAAPAQ